MVVDHPLGIDVRTGRIDPSRALARPEPHVADDDVVAAHRKLIAADADPARRRLAGDRDVPLVAIDAQLAVNRDPAANVEHNRAAARRCVVDAEAQAARARVVEVRHMIDVAAAPALGRSLQTLRPAEKP